MKNLAKRRIAPIFTAVVLGFFTSCSSPVEGQVTGFDETTETDVIGDRWEPGLADTMPEEGPDVKGRKVVWKGKKSKTDPRLKSNFDDKVIKDVKPNWVKFNNADTLPSGEVRKLELEKVVDRCQAVEDGFFEIGINDPDCWGKLCFAEKDEHCEPVYETKYDYEILVGYIYQQRYYSFVKLNHLADLGTCTPIPVSKPNKPEFSRTNIKCINSYEPNVNKTTDKEQYLIFVEEQKGDKRFCMVVDEDVYRQAKLGANIKINVSDGTFELALPDPVEAQFRFELCPVL